LADIEDPKNKSTFIYWLPVFLRKIVQQDSHMRARYVPKEASFEEFRMSAFAGYGKSKAAWFQEFWISASEAHCRSKAASFEEFWMSAFAPSAWTSGHAPTNL
jgi:hypothetical protein